MDAKAKIRSALKQIMSDGEANACTIWKGWDVGTGLAGWHYQRFNQTATYIGNNLDQALAWIAELPEERQL